MTTLPRIFESLIQQHHSLMDAILAGNSEAALQAAQHHLTFVEDSIKDLDAEEARKIRSLRRLTITGV
ncbi:FCD domain-containing protein [Thiofilum flexile]|uniref:FCD domain-containing protein n=1 Tax=Thiofilum flexile TaxID=125627 RepID=UPI000DA265AF|nr:FCD domain-containing protein [Thiofilum flexile]